MFRKIFFIALLIPFYLCGNCQRVLPNNFKIGSFFEIYNDDSLKIYFSCTGTIVDKRCASYYRIGRMDSTIINFTGPICDYDLNDKLYFKASVFNNNLEGKAYYYYENGNIKETGIYKNNIRDGNWTFYYENGSIEKIYDYIDGSPLVLEAYTPNGKATVINGKGKFKTEFSTYLQCGKFEASGHILKGKRDGKWTFANPEPYQVVATETYKDGKFINGFSKGYEYTKKPEIRLTEFYPNENLKLANNMLGCDGDIYTFVKYKGTILISAFYPELQNKLNAYNKSIKDQWIIVGIRINSKDKLDQINVASSINDTSIENYIYNCISKMTNWEAESLFSKKVESNIFFSILVYNNQIIIATYYLSKKGIY